MTPAARVQAAIEVLDAVAGGVPDVDAAPAVPVVDAARLLPERVGGVVDPAIDEERVGARREQRREGRDDPTLAYPADDECDGCDE